MVCPSRRSTRSSTAATSRLHRAACAAAVSTRAPSALPCASEPCVHSSAPCSLPSIPSVTQELVAEGGYFFANRLIMLVAVEIRGKRRYIPMLCDTGAPKTCISTITLEKFGLEASAANHIRIKLGERSVYAAIPDENCAAYVRGLNILGSDVLQLLVPDVVPLLISSINREAKRS